MPRFKHCAGVFRPTIVSWTVGAALQLPPDHGARTLILHDVDALSPEQQQQVLGWLQQDRGDRPSGRDLVPAAVAAGRIGLL